MKREKLVFCNVIVRRDRCTVFAFTFSSLVPTVGKDQKKKNREVQYAHKTHFSAIV